MTFNSVVEKPSMLFISLRISLPLMDSCDSQHNFTRKQYLQTLWNTAAVWPFFFFFFPLTSCSSRFISAFKVNCSSYDYQLLRKGCADNWSQSVMPAFVAYSSGLKDIWQCTSVPHRKHPPHAQRYVHIHMHAYTPTLLIFQAKSTVLLRSIKCFCW